jgi:hypothetical protein
MSLTGALENQNIGGGGGWGGFGSGGFGAFGLIGLLGIDSLGGRRRGGDDDCECNKTLAVLAGLANNKDATIAEGRALAGAICATNSNVKDAQFALAIQAQNLQQEVKDQATAFAIVNDRRFDELTAQTVNQTASILARINDVENQGLRDQLFLERRRGDSREVEINIQNSNAQSQAQVQAQFQAQNAWLDKKFYEFDNQINNTKQGIINLGTMVASGTQATSATNIGK